MEKGCLDLGAWINPELPLPSAFLQKLPKALVKWGKGATCWPKGPPAGTRAGTIQGGEGSGNILDLSTRIHQPSGSHSSSERLSNSPYATQRKVAMDTKYDSLQNPHSL